MLLARRLFESVLALVSALVFWEFLSSIYLSNSITVYIAAFLSVLTLVTGGVNIYIKDKLLEEEYIKPVIINVDKVLVYQVVKLQARRVCSILVNLAGAVLPMLFSAIALLTIAIVKLDILPQVLINASLLTLLYHKLSVLIKDKGVGVPIAVSIAVTVVLSTTTSLCLNLNNLISFALTFASSAIALLVGVDLMNLRRVVLFNVRKIIIGGMGAADALLLIPAASALVTVNVVRVLSALVV
ncbi:MAG: DUF1614 domain-containing protein [Desulfurococcales archaeon]|nr:DUF1614 domain-containing protein [Desulfurococcales archaeon]